MSFRYITNKPNNNNTSIINLHASSPRGGGGGGGPESPRAEVGEIDTRAPFQSVKAAVSLFGEVAISKLGNRPLIRRSRASSSENVLDKETQLVLSHNELNKLKENYDIIQTTKAKGLSELDRAKRTLHDLTNKLNSITQSNQSILQLTEDVKNQVLLLETSKLSSMSPHGVVNSKHDLDMAKEQYLAIFAELDASKQHLTKVRQDFDAALEAKIVSFQQAADARHAAKSNKEQITQISKEITDILDSHSQVALATEQAREEHHKIIEEQNACTQSHQTSIQQAKDKLLLLEKEIDDDHEHSADLENKLAETSREIEALQENVKTARASDAESKKVIRSELNDATKMLHHFTEEESVLRNLVDSLTVEVENVHTQRMKLSKRLLRVDEMRLKLEQSKSELETSIMDDMKARNACDGLISELEAIKAETENTIMEAEELNKNAEQVRREAENARNEMEEEEKKLPAAMRDAKDAEFAEKIANDEIQILSDRTKALRDSSHYGDQSIKLSTKEFEALSRKSEESEVLVKMKLAAAQAQLAAICSSQNIANKVLQANYEEIEETKDAIEAALREADMAEEARKAVEKELVKLARG